MNDQRSINSIARSHGPEQESLFDVLGVPPPCADSGARLLPCIIKQPAHLLWAKTSNASGGGARAHGSDQIVRFLHPRADSSHGPQGDVVTKRHSAQEMRPANAELLADC